MIPEDIEREALHEGFVEFGREAHEGPVIAFEKAFRCALRSLAAYGWELRPKIATRKMTIAGEKLGAGEAWVEDCWSAMWDAAKEG